MQSDFTGKPRVANFWKHLSTCSRKQGVTAIQQTLALATTTLRNLKHWQSPWPHDNHWRKTIFPSHFDYDMNIICEIRPGLWQHIVTWCLPVRVHYDWPTICVPSSPREVPAFYHMRANITVKTGTRNRQSSGYLSLDTMVIHLKKNQNCYSEWRKEELSHFHECWRLKEKFFMTSYTNRE